MTKTIKIGKVALTFGGDYDQSKSYSNKTCVLYNHVSWASKKDVPAGIEPGTNDEYWQKMAERGSKGEKGDKGDKGNAAYMTFEVDDKMNLIFNQLSEDGEIEFDFKVDDSGNLIVSKK